MKKFAGFRFFNQGICSAYLALILLVFGCHQQENARHDLSVTSNLVAAKPVPVKMYKPPLVTLLDTCPPPLVITLPVKPGTSYGKGKNKIDLTPPVVIKAGFNIPMKSYNVEDGLAQSNVQSSFCDRDGNLWFGTEDGGVSCFNGRTFTGYTMENGLVDDQIFSIFQDKEGILWFGSWNGVTKYDGRRFTRYSSLYTSSSNLPTCCVFKSFTQDKKNNIWMGSESGLSVFDGKYFKSFHTSDGLINESAFALLTDKNGNIWIGTDSGVSLYNGRSFTNFTMANGLPGDHISCLLEDQGGIIWIGTKKGISLYDGKSFKNFTTADGLLDNNITSILEDADHHIWIGTNNGGVSEYNGNTFMNYTRSNGLASNNISSIVKDRSGNIWISSPEEGICKYPGNGFITMTKGQGLPSNSINAIFQSRDGDLWFGGYDNGVTSYDGKSFTTFSKNQGLIGNNIGDIYQDSDGNMWFGTYDGVSCFDGRSFTSYTTAQGLSANTAWSIAQDKNGNIWFATFGGGVCKLSHDRKTFTSFFIDTLISTGNVHEVKADKDGNIWLCLDEGDIFKYDGSSFINYGKPQGSKTLGMLGCWIDGHNYLWFANGSGICRYDGKSFLTFSHDQGLPDNLVSDIKEDKKGVIWAGTRLGLSGLEFRPKKKGAEDSIFSSDIPLDNSYLYANYTGFFVNYGYKNGFPVREINYTNSLFVDSGNILWAGTSDKLVRFDQQELRKNTNTPLLSINSIKINGEAVPWHDLKTDTAKTDSSVILANVNEEQMLYQKLLRAEERDSIKEKYSAVAFDSLTNFISLPTGLKLPYKYNTISFDFSAIEPGRPELVEYQYLLEGYNNNWNDISKSTIAGFGNLHEGKYTFKLRAFNPGVAKPGELEYRFEILPPWYRTWWAYVCYLIIISFFMQRFIRWRIKKLNREKVLLEQKVQVRTNQLQEEKRRAELALGELRSAQTQLIQSEKMASLGELTAGIAHEIQNPLNFVNNFSDVNQELLTELKEEADKGNLKEVKAIATDVIANEEKINHHGRRADAIVKGMLQHSRSGASVKEPTDINALAEEYLRLSYHGLRAKDKEFNASTKTDLDATLGKINIVPQDIGRVLLNLYNNAFYAVTEKKKQQTENYEPTISVTTKKNGDRVAITVSDNGNGIPQKIVEKIFQPFFTTKPTGQGTGLGLSLSYDIVKAQGGEIKVRTKEGEWSEFIIELPIK